MQLQNLFPLQTSPGRGVQEADELGADSLGAAAGEDQGGGGEAAGIAGAAAEAVPAAEGSTDTEPQDHQETAPTVHEGV